MQKRVKRPKKAVNLSVDQALLDEAKAAGTNLSALLEAALREELRAHRRKQWLEQNRDAIAASNLEQETHGPWYTPEWLPE